MTGVQTCALPILDNLSLNAQVKQRVPQRRRTRGDCTPRLVEMMVCRYDGELAVFGTEVVNVMTRDKAVGSLLNNSYPSGWGCSRRRTANASLRTYLSPEFGGGRQKVSKHGPLPWCQIWLRKIFELDCGKRNSRLASRAQWGQAAMAWVIPWGTGSDVGREGRRTIFACSEVVLVRSPSRVP